MQEHFRGKIIKRMMGDTKFKEFCQEYDKVKLVNVGREVFQTPATKTAIEKIKHWDF